jgi:acetylornithine deacetylase/succinyl-diaminopimelate desuccinylase-like protein
MAMQFKEILGLLPRLRDGAREIREILLANLAMISEIPAPTFGEHERVRMIQQRLSECGLQNCSTDEAGNALGVLPGEEDNNILVVAHADTLFPPSVDHTITVAHDRVSGPGIADNSLGLAVLVSLPTLLEHLEIELDATLYLMGAARSLGRGDLEGLRFFLSNTRTPLRAGVCIEGVELGRLSYASLGMLRGEVRVSVPEEYDWTRFGATSAIIILNDVLNAVNGIRLPRRPRTTIVIGSIEGGKSYNTIATNAFLRFEIRSESAAMVREIRRSMNHIASEISSKYGAQVDVEIFARRQPGGISFGHPLAHSARRIMRSLRIAARVSPSVSELSAFIDRHIPAITIGLSTGERLSERDETIEINRMFTGVAQLLGILLAIDGGYCNGD